MANENNTRAAAVALLADGEATLAEVAELAGKSRQLVRYWAMAADIDVPVARADRLTRLWAKALKRLG